MKSDQLFVRILILIVGFGCVEGAMAADPAAGWYLGAGVGKSNATHLDGIDTTLANYGITSRSITDDTATAWKLFGGYQVNRYFGVEGGYAKLGQSNFTSSVTLPGTGTGSGTWDPKDAWSLSAVGYLPVVDRFSLFGKVGLAYSKVNFGYADTVGDAISASKHTTDPLYGAGLKYDLTKETSVRGEFERYQNIGDSSVTGQSSVNVWSVGLQYHFF
jgi:OOP family OmpA-OmpF porin